MNEGTSFARLDPDSGERFQRLRAELGVSAFGMNLLTLQPGQCSRIHSHAAQEEVLLVLEGELTLSIEDDERQLTVGELVRIAPRVRRQLINRRPRRLVMFALGGAGEHDGRDGQAYPSWNAIESTPPRDTPFPPDVPVDAI